MTWIRSLMSELGLQVSQPPPIYFDNIGATYLYANPVFHSHMKHIAIDYHFVRERIQSGDLSVSHVSPSDQVANGLTKPLPSSRLAQLRSKIGVRPLSILRGILGYRISLVQM